MGGSQPGAPSMDPPLLYTVKCVTTSFSTDMLQYIELKKFYNRNIKRKKAF